MEVGILQPFKYLRRQAIALLYAIAVLFIEYSLAQCPSQCSCIPYTAGKATSCGPGLTSIPNNLPSDTLIFSVSVLPNQQKNNVPSLSTKDFVAISRVKRIQIAYSNLQRVDDNTFAKLPDLLSLDLKGNGLIRLTRSVFHGLTNLELLDLTDNKGCLLEVDTFDDMTALSTLRLAGIGLTNIGDLLSKLKSLRTCDLHGNKLVRLDSGSFAHLSNLRQLDVSFNNLREIQPGLKGVLSGLSSFKLDNNPWRCNCALIWAKTLPAKFIHPSPLGGGGIICDKPAQAQFRDLRDVIDSDMACIPAQIVSCTQTVVVKEGEPVKVSCTVKGDPFPDVIWKMPSSNEFIHTLQANITSQTTISLPQSVFALHNGNWQIDVYNFNSSDTKTVRIDVLTTTTMPTTSPTTRTKTTSKVKPSTTFSTSVTQTSRKTTTSPINSRPFPANLLSSLMISTNSIPGNHSPDKQNAPVTLTTFFYQSTHPTTELTSGPSNINIMVIVAASAGGLVCLTGIIICVTVIYKIKKKAKVAARRKSTYSTTGDIGMFTRFPAKLSGTFRLQ